MRIVNRATFLQLPHETVFAKYQPQSFGDLLIKGETHGNDFLYQSINDAIMCNDSDELYDLLDDAEKGNSSLDMDFDCQARDGLFEENQLFAVWDRRDVESLITRLQSTLTQARTAEGDTHCTCTLQCANPCKGSCGCDACSEEYGDFLSGE